MTQTKLRIDFRLYVNNISPFDDFFLEASSWAPLNPGELLFTMTRITCYPNLITVTTIRAENDASLP